MTAEHLQKRDLEPILAAHTGNRTFALCFQRAESGEDLLRLLGRYIHFNSVFGGGVANLAGEIAVRQDLFRDPDEAVTHLADRSADVAADIFFAAVDEFDDRSTPQRDTHRTLAQATLKATGRFFGYEATALNALIAPNEATRTAIGSVCEGYGLNQVVDERKLFQAIGFHAGSEILADEEFRILDEHLRANRPELVAYLEKKQVEIGGVRHAAYWWIHIHTSVEADHFEFAARGANHALQYYAGEQSPDQVKAWIIAGFQQFGEVQTTFMEGLSAS